MPIDECDSEGVCGSLSERMLLFSAHRPDVEGTDAGLRSVTVRPVKPSTARSHADFKIKLDIADIRDGSAPNSTFI